MKLLISPSKLEKIRLHVTDAYQGTITKEKVIEAIKGTAPWSPKMEFGGAFHAVLEHGPERFYNATTGKYDVMVQGLPDPYIMEPEEIVEAVKFREQHPDMIHEIKIAHKIEVPGYEIVLYMRTDGMEGEVVHEHKTTDKAVDIKNYEDSLQWKCYVMGTDCPYVQYNIFQYNKPKTGFTEVTPHVIQLLPYYGLHEEVTEWVKRLILFCDNENLLEFIKSKY